MMSRANAKRYPQGIMGTVCIPWDESYRLDERLFRKTVSHCASLTPLLYLGGTAGEGYALDAQLFEQVHRIFKDEMAGADDYICAGVISTSLHEIKRRIETAGNLGFSHIQISVPCWDPPLEDEVGMFFDDILSSFPELRFMHYNRPFSGRTVSAQTYRTVCDAYENLVAAKIVTDSTRLTDALMQEELPLELFFTNASFAYAALQGECGLLCAIETLSHRFTEAFYRAGVQHDVQDLFRMNNRLRKVTSALLSLYGPGIHIDGAFDKMYHKHHDDSFPLRLLPPYRGADDALFDTFEKSLQTDFPEFMTDA